MTDERSIAGDLIKGAIAGAVATWVMGRVTTFLYEIEEEEAVEQEEEVREGRTAAETAAMKAAEQADIQLDDQRREQGAEAIHWGLGIGAGAVYGVLKHRLPLVGRTQGIGFGSTFFMVVDEGMNTLLGLTPGPRAFPWQAHARGLAGHVVFGVSADATLDILDRIT